jgi:cyclic 2,3-diphosphoglycerate synthetase
MRTVFRPSPLGSIEGKRTAFATTAPPAVGEKLAGYLEQTYDCAVVGVSHNLSRRPRLREDLDRLLEPSDVDVLLTELKAAAVDVATAMALERGIEVVYADNVPVPAGGAAELETAVLEVIQSAGECFKTRKNER